MWKQISEFNIKSVKKAAILLSFILVGLMMLVYSDQNPKQELKDQLPPDIMENIKEQK